MLTPETYAAGAARRAPRAARPRRHRDGAAARGLRGGQDRAWGHRLRGRAAADRRASSPSATTSPGRCARSTATSSSTSTRTSTRSSSGCSTCGWGSATTSAWSVTRPRRSTRSPAPARATCSSSRPGTPRPRWSGWCATTARHRRWWGSPTSSCAGRRGRCAAMRCVLQAQGQDGPTPVLDRSPGRPGRGRRDRRARSPSGSPTGCLPPRSPSCSAPTASPRRSSPRWPTTACPTSCEAGSGSSPAREVRDAILLLRGAARSDDGSKPLPELVRDVLLGAGWTREAPSSGRRRSGALGVAAVPSPRSPTTWS